MTPTACTSRSFVPLLLLLSSQLGLVVKAQDGKWKDSYNLDFSYDPSASNGPGAWGSVDGVGLWADYNNQFVSQNGNQCGPTATRPSPLNLQLVSEECTDLHEPLTRQISEEDCTRDDLTFDITPFGLRVAYPLTDETCLRPTLTISGRFENFVLNWMELHARSEHVVEGKRFDAELQMIHSGTGVEEGQVLAVSLLIEASAMVDDLEFEWLLEQWNAVSQQESQGCGRRLRQATTTDTSSTRAQPDSKAQTHVEDSNDEERQLQFRPSPCETDRFGGGCEPLAPRRRMFPYNLWQSIWYYGYSGSLTSPPCSNIVQWRVLEEPLRISRRQYKELARLLSLSRSEDCQSDTAVNPETGENNRPLQQPNEFFQTVYRCTSEDFGFYVYPPEEQ